MHYLLNIIYVCLLLAASPWIAFKAWRSGKYRAGWSQKLWGRVPVRIGDKPCVWFHAVSVGEVNLLKAIVSAWQTRHPDHECVISSTTRTGFELATKSFARHCVFYCPLDFSWAVSAALSRLRPDLLVLVELELWPNLVRVTQQRGVRVAVVNGRLSEGSWRGYRRIQPLIRAMLQSVNLIAVQNEDYAARFLDLGAQRSRVHITGNIKFDNAVTNRRDPRTMDLSELARIQDDDIIFLAGSTQHPEEQLAVEALAQTHADHPNLRLVLVPRHPERFDDVAELLRARGLPWVRRSELSPSGEQTDWRILLVDTVGELGAWWGTAHIAFVGGSLGTRGGQNMIEPAGFGAAVSFGPNTNNFRDIVAQLLACAAAEVVHDGEELTQFVRRCAGDPAYRAALGRAGQQLVLEQRGAIQRTMQLLDLHTYHRETACFSRQIAY